MGGTKGLPRMFLKFYLKLIKLNVKPPLPSVTPWNPPVEVVPRANKAVTKLLSVAICAVVSAPKAVEPADIVVARLLIPTAFGARLLSAASFVARVIPKERIGRPNQQAE